jgi:hypothetical protein
MDDSPKNNAVECSACGTVNPLFYISCTKCKRKLDLTDKRIFDAGIAEHKPYSAKGQTLLGGVIFGVIMLGVMFFLFKLLGIGSSSDSKMIPSVGEATVLTCKSGIPAAISKESLSALNASFRAKDEFGFNQLERSGEVVVLPDLTHAKVIGIDLGAVKIRVSSGTYADRAFFVDPQYVK